MSTVNIEDLQNAANVNATYNAPESVVMNESVNVKQHNAIRANLLKQHVHLRDDLDQLRRNGYVILKGLLSAEYLQTLDSVSNVLLSGTPFGRNEFEGRKTKRVYSVVSRSRIYDELILNARIRSICDYYLLPNYLLTVSQLIEIHPGSKRQAFHRDAGSYHYAPLPRVEHPWRLTTIWALDTFTEENGATVIIPKSHLWNEHRAIDYDKDEFVKVLLEKGDCLLFLGTLVHCGGQNKCAAPRRAITIGYCQPWLRVQENDLLSVPLDEVKMLPPAIKQMIGYSMHNAHGNVAGRHPARSVDKLLVRYSKL